MSPDRQAPGGIGPDDVPRLSPMFRLQWEEAQGCRVLLYPEGMVRLNGPAGEILNCCDGVRSVAAIIGELAGRFPDAATLSNDVYQFLDKAHDNQWIDYAPA
ncbi:pyrroloquinoline quinone biosynthesis peptide chaperone PqqD [uncultured Thiodictyon sp.]|jgi:pyrroloquinoline quinone biosynthesis protein D|uniref:pyrroloquinoline quinone biosynthesis peptide chaperone PqqD n=1 Tax=uncultured Thiodictyon sp. TaxID=1846217 RepID=UPI0025CE98ED|nr:pyrroloquinoline quinone biosynthesis peptide chaperone PqqD [uncultured Thiodictyon sp.]